VEITIVPQDLPVRRDRPEMMCPIAVETYSHIDALCAEHGIEAGEAVSLLAFKAFAALDLGKLEFWIRVSDIAIEKAATALKPNGEDNLAA
jgi:hypothetical protein